MQLRDVLPPDSFVPFVTRRLNNPGIVWQSPYMNNANFDSSAIYCMPYAGEPEALYGSDTRVMLAERYGGEGVGRNGGGARCGLDGTLQIKGIGKNPLAGEDNHFWHSHGGCALELAVREAIWGEVCHTALPYGGARAYAIVSTNTEVPYPSHQGRRDARRALLYRQPKLRPAHFLRSIFFSPAPAMRGLPTDSVRTMFAVEKFWHAMQTMGIMREDCHEDNAIDEILRRSAQQIATARAKKLMHGGLSPSNIALDGAWLDYDTITTVSDYGRVIMGGFDIADFWGEHSQLPKAFEELFFTLKKYGDRHHAPINISSSSIRSRFSCFFAPALALEFAKLTGVPVSVLKTLKPSQLLEAFNAIYAITAEGNSRPFYYSPRHEWKMTVPMGSYHINTWLAEFSKLVGKDPETMIESVRALPSHQHKVRRLVAAVTPIYQAFALRYGLGPAAKEFLTINAHRVNARLPQLYRHLLDSRIDAHCAGNGDTENFIERTLEFPKFVLSELDDDDRVDFSALGYPATSLCPEKGYLVSGAPVCWDSLAPARARLMEAYSDKMEQA